MGYNDLSPRMGCSGLKTERVPKADQAALNKATSIGGLMVYAVIFRFCGHLAHFTHDSELRLSWGRSKKRHFISVSYGSRGTRSQLPTDQKVGSSNLPRRAN